MKNWLKIIFTIVLVLVADLVTKHFLFEKSFTIIPHILSVKGGIVKNEGAAWGIFSGKKALLLLISALMIIALFIFNHFVKRKNTFYCLSFGFIIGGAVGNMVDRIAFSYVRDFICFDFLPTFPYFNVADSFLCIGAVMLACFIIFGSKEKKND